MNKKLISKKKMSEMVGWSESNGRRWVKHFKEYIPEEESSGNRVMYNSESLRIMKLLKSLNESGLFIPEIRQIFQKEGLPKNIREEERLLEKLNKKEHKHIKDTIPSIKDMIMPYLNLIKDGKAYPANEIKKKLVTYFHLTDEQQVMKYENTSDIIFLSRVRSVRYSLKKENYIEEVNKLTYQNPQMD
jgi:restriction system protein